MNNTKKGIIVGTIAAVIIPLATFAAGGGFHGHFNGFGEHGTGSGFTLPANVQAALTASGIAIPTADELKTDRDAMQKVGEAMKNLSATDKATLEKMRQDEAKAERDFLRTKGVPFPSEDAITKIQTFQQAVGNLMHSQR